MSTLNVYQEHGYESREHCLECLAEDTGIPLHHVCYFADLLGSTEDFDGLVTTLEDM